MRKEIAMNNQPFNKETAHCITRDFYLILNFICSNCTNVSITCSRCKIGNIGDYLNYVSENIDKSFN